MTQKEKKLKLLSNEVVNAETFMLASKVCETANFLGEKWAAGVSYLNDIFYEKYRERTGYNLAEGSFSNVDFYLQHGYKVISSTEWLNRHGIFIPGQKVMNGNEEMIYAGPGKQCVNIKYSDNYRNDGSYTSIYIMDIKSPHPEFKEEIEPLEIDGKRYDKEAVKALIEKLNIKEL